MKAIWQYSTLTSAFKQFIRPITALAADDGGKNVSCPKGKLYKYR